jgi:ABC-2 type transport system permease protein
VFEARFGLTASWPAMLAEQVRVDTLKVLRLPGLLVALILLPLVLFTFLGLSHLGDRLGGISAGPYLLASFGAFSTSSSMLLTFGLGLSQERAAKLDVLMRASPMPAAVFLGAKVITALAVALMSLLVLMAYVILVGGVHLELASLAYLVAVLLLGALPFLAMGFSLAYLAEPATANAVLNLAYVVLGFGSGLLIPLTALPAAVQAVAPVLPTYRYASLAWSAVGSPSPSTLVDVIWLLAYAAVFFTIAVWAYQREEQRKFA